MIVTETNYAVKHLTNGAARVFINNSHLLRQAGFTSGTPINAEQISEDIVITPSPNGSKSVISTSRGELVELRDKQTGKALKGLTQVKVRFERNKIVISAKLSDKLKRQRESSFKNAVVKKSITSASLCSGLGMLTYQIAEGLKKSGIQSKIAFSNDLDSLAMALQLEGNPIWQSATKDAQAVASDIREIDFDMLPFVNLVEIGYPCPGQSTMSPLERRDINHPDVGTMFVPILNALTKLNPAVIVFENAVPFIKSQTLELLQRELPGYRFESTVLRGQEWGDLETRSRACITAVSEGLPPLNIDNLLPPTQPSRRALKEILEPIPLDDSCWRVMNHITNKTKDARLNFKLNTYTGSETTICSLTAGNQSPKINSPYIAHPTFEHSGLMRLINGVEHAKIREVPPALFNLLKKVISGSYPLVSSRGSSTAVHRMLGNGVSPKAWRGFGEFLGSYFNECAKILTGHTSVQMQLSLI